MSENRLEFLRLYRRRLRRRQQPRRLRLAPVLALLLATPLLAEGLSPQEKRGKQIYTTGTSPRGTPITARVGGEATPLPGTAATCAACHGSDGRGRPEAGVIPSDITWDYLIKPYGHRHLMGRQHPAFSADSLAETIRHGRDPAGNVLDPSMPVYAISDDDLADLLTYLRQLERDSDPGLSDNAIRIGTILPASGRLAKIGLSLREILQAAFEEINARGGINGRRLQLVVVDYDAARQSPLASAESLLRDGQVFAILSPVVLGADQEISDLVESEKIPLIGPLTLLSPDPFLLNDFTFYLFSGLREQMRVLIDFATRELQLSSPKTAVLLPTDDRYRDMVQVITAQGKANGWTRAPLEIMTGSFDPSEAAERLAKARIDIVFALGSSDLPALLRAGEVLGWRPDVLLAGASVRPALLDLPESLQGKIHAAYPTVPTDHTAAGSAALRGLVERVPVTSRHRTSQISAYVSAKVLATGLKRAGRDLSREKLVRALERLYEYSTGLTPPITYGANRRIGALGAYIVAIDLKNDTFTPTHGWMTPQ
ncbi:MAG: ABC transporter substrate-binding protein [Acidobacteriota bacterium]